MARGRDQTSPRIDPLTLPDLAPGDPADLVAGARLDGERFDHVRLDEDLRGLVLDGCELVEATGDEAHLDGGRLLESVVDRLNVTTLTAKGSVWRDVRVTGSRVGAAEWFDVEWRGGGVVGWRLGFPHPPGGRRPGVRV